MTNEFQYFGDDARKEIGNNVLRARNLLKPLGLAVSVKRFPFAMHHAAYRNRLPRIKKHLLTHFQIAGLLNTWALERNSPHDYVWQAVHGALMSLSSKKYVLEELPEEVRRELNSISNGKEFEIWAVKRLELQR